jgi:hypothetical protein
MCHSQHEVIDHDAQTNRNYAEQRDKKPEERIGRANEEVVHGIVGHGLCGITSILVIPVRFVRSIGISGAGEIHGEEDEDGETYRDISPKALIETFCKAHEDAWSLLVKLI